MSKKKASTTTTTTTTTTAITDGLTSPAPSHDAAGAPSRGLTGKPCPSTKAGK